MEIGPTTVLTNLTDTDQQFVILHCVSFADCRAVVTLAPPRRHRPEHIQAPLAFVPI
eukprot:COSAG02_NODE_2442_length_8854_cov_2.621359_7_plen_57_part_00